MELKNSGFAQRLNYGLVLTGGTARMKDVDELFRRQTKYDVRIGIPEEGITQESRPLVQSPDAATVIGLLLRGARTGVCITPLDEEWMAQRAAEEQERQRAEEAERQAAAQEAERERRRQEEEAEKQRRIEELKRQIDNLQDEGAQLPPREQGPVVVPKPEPSQVAPEKPEAPKPEAPKVTPPEPPKPESPTFDQKKNNPANDGLIVDPPIDAPPTEGEKKRNWKSLFSKMINSVNESFEKVGSGNDDEEI